MITVFVLAVLQCLIGMRFLKASGAALGMNLACRGLPFTLIYCDHSKRILIWMVRDLHT